MEHVEQDQRGDAPVGKRKIVGAHGAVMPGSGDQIGELQIGDELARETRSGTELDPWTRGGLLQGLGQKAIPGPVQLSNGWVLLPRHAVTLEPRQGGDSLTLGRAVWTLGGRLAHLGCVSWYMLKDSSFIMPGAAL